MKRIYLLLLIACLAGCKKDFLNAVPDKSLLIPATVADMQALLDNIAVFNITPAITANADGDFYTSEAAWKAWNTDAERNSYTWSADIWGTYMPADWTVPYQQVFYANVVLDGLAVLPPATSGAAAVKGTALFSRAFAYYNLLQTFSSPELGLSLRLTADVNPHPPRSSPAETYAQVINDLRQARGLLPLASPYKTRPTLAAAFGLLARAYLAAGDFVAAGKYADSCLQQYSALIDYNTLSATATRPFPRAVPSGNNEVIYYAVQTSWGFINNAATLVDTTLYRSYAANDLRKTILFKASGNSATFKGNYTGIIAQFAGLATDELFLIRAECAARRGLKDAALADLNTVLAKRWKTGTFVPLAAADAPAALALVLTERRKELVGRNLRWADLKRLKPDLTLTHVLGSTTYTLPAGSQRYAYPLPADEVTLGGVAQNPR
jgi:tetratricopeptide (TPR) repeat protein